MQYRQEGRGRRIQHGAPDETGWQQGRTVTTPTWAQASISYASRKDNLNNIASSLLLATLEEHTLLFIQIALRTFGI